MAIFNSYVKLPDLNFFQARMFSHSRARSEHFPMKWMGSPWVKHRTKQLGLVSNSTTLQSNLAVAWYFEHNFEPFEHHLHPFTMFKVYQNHWLSIPMQTDCREEPGLTTWELLQKLRIGVASAKSVILWVNLAIFHSPEVWLNWDHSPYQPWFQGSGEQWGHYNSSKRHVPPKMVIFYCPSGLHKDVVWKQQR